MKKVIFKNKKENTVNEYTIGQIGEKVFALVYNVKETNDAIRWCNTHKRWRRSGTRRLYNRIKGGVDVWHLF